MFDAIHRVSGSGSVSESAFRLLDSDTDPDSDTEFCMLMLLFLEQSPMRPAAHPRTHEKGMMERAYSPHFLFVLATSWGVAPG